MATTPQTVRLRQLEASPWGCALAWRVAKLVTLWCCR